MYLRCGNQILKSLPSPSSPFFPCFSPNPQPPVPLLSALLLSLIEFNSAQGDSVIDRLRETEEIQFKLNSFFSQCTFCVKSFFFFYCALGFAIDSLLETTSPSPSPTPLLPSTPSLPSPTETWPATAAWPDVKEKEREQKKRWRTGRGHFLRGMRIEKESGEERDEEKKKK